MSQDLLLDLKLNILVRPFTFVKCAQRWGFFEEKKKNLKNKKWLFFSLQAKMAPGLGGRKCSEFIFHFHPGCAAVPAEKRTVGSWDQSPPPRNLRAHSRLRGPSPPPSPPSPPFLSVCLPPSSHFPLPLSWILPHLTFVSKLLILVSQPQAPKRQKKCTYPYAQGFSSPRELLFLMQMPA